METDYNDLLHATVKELKDLTQKVESAFPKDEDGEPDYGAHRAYHRKQNSIEDRFNDSKAKLINEILKWVTTGALTIIGASLLHTYLPK